MVLRRWHVCCKGRDMKPELAPARNMIRLSPHARLRADPEACLTLRYPDLGCDECVRICPTTALSLGESTLVLSDACTDCGRCAAQCPTGALSPFVLDGDLPTDAPGGIRVECAKVPRDLSGANALQVSCTGALSVSQWLRLVRSAGTSETTLVDRGWCEGCESGGQRHPAGRNIEEVNAILSEIGRPETQRIRVVDAPLPVTLRPRHVPDSGQARPIDRRGFLRRLAGDAAAAGHRFVAGESTAQPSLPNGRRRILPSARLATLASLRELTGIDTPLPARLSHVVTVTDACHGHQVCARSCPTTALRNIEDEALAGLSFNPALCIGCGLCEKQCPEQAIRIERASTHALMAKPHLLVAHRRQRCLDCGTQFVPGRDAHKEDDVCPACAKSRDLGRSLFADLFRT